MIVIGTDVHKQTHCGAAVEVATGQRLEVREAPARAPGFRVLLKWARGLGEERVWAIEDCRHVSGSLERFLIGAGERIVRLAPKLSAGARRHERKRGKSDPIDALAIARAAIREGIDTLPAAFLDERAREIKLLADHRDALVGGRTRGVLWRDGSVAGQRAHSGLEVDLPVVDPREPCAQARSAPATLLTDGKDSRFIRRTVGLWPSAPPTPSH